MTRRHTFLQLTFLLPAVLLLTGASALAQQEENPTGPAAGRALAAELCAMAPAENTNWHGTLKILGRDKKVPPVPVLCQTTTGDTNWSVMYLASSTEASGSEKLTVLHFADGPNQYLYARAAAPGAPLEEPKRLSGAEADVPLAGSDFWLSDLGFEFYHWPEQRRLKGEMHRSRPCYVLESINPLPTSGGYSRVVTWVEKESGAPIQAEAYGADNKLMKEFWLGSFKKVNGRYELKDMKINNSKTKSRTQLVFDLESK
ncbi:MAG: outer rane lipoproteinsorting protein [Pedosphaera sp.]|nr:outer rane lipoproteinsorting protein [Pedosphaera sp.]